jgi:hypothetical protein
MFWRRRRHRKRTRPTGQQDKRAGNPRPDQPTPSDGATLGERGEGAHEEYLDAPPPGGSASDADAGRHGRE